MVLQRLHNYEYIFKRYLAEWSYRGSTTMSRYIFKRYLADWSYRGSTTIHDPQFAIQKSKGADSQALRIFVKTILT